MNIWKYNISIPEKDEAYQASISEADWEKSLESLKIKPEVQEVESIEDEI